MKRILQFLSPIIFSLLFYMPVSASSFTASSGALSVASEFALQLASQYFAVETGRQIYGNDISEAFQVSGFDSNASDSLTWEYSSLNFTPSGKLYDSNGNVIDPSNCTLATGRNSFISTTFIFDNNTGDILSIGDSFDNAESTLNGYKPGSSVSPGVFMPGGSISSSYDPFESFKNYYFSGAYADALAIYNASNATTQKEEFLKTLPTASWASSTDYVHNGSFGYYCVANVPGICVNVGRYGWVYTGGADEHYPLTQKYMPQFLLNDGYQAYFYCWNDGSDNTYNNNANIFPNSLTSSDYPSSSNYSLMYPLYSNNPYSGGYNGENAIYNDEAISYLQDVVMTVPLSISNTISDVVNYDRFMDSAIDRDTILNPTYNENSYVTTNNFPIYNEITFPIYAPVYNYYTNVYENENVPGIGNTGIGSIVDPTLPSEIPILSNLQKRFPFSIPWDIYSLVSGLAVERETPYIDTVIHIPVADVDWVLQYDLHAFDDTASLFRTLFLISFIIALAWFSYDHFFGS